MLIRIIMYLADGVPAVYSVHTTPEGLEEGLEMVRARGETFWVTLFTAHN